MSTIKKVLAVAPVVAFLLVLTAPAAMADQLYLNIDQCSGSCGPAGTIFGTVILTQNGTAVDFDVHANSPYVFAKSGAADFQAFKFNAMGITLSDITVTQTVAGQTLAAQTGTFNGDGTGLFSFGISCTTCKGGLSDSFSNDVKFEVANSTIADFTSANSLGYIFVADFGNPSTGNTGPIGAMGAGPQGTPTPVPEPGTIWLFGSALLGLGYVGRRTTLARASRENHQ